MAQVSERVSGQQALLADVQARGQAAHSPGPSANRRRDRSTAG